jgi:1-acyl-sn-glycerol-3-phosphate acyltransferase
MPERLDRAWRLCATAFSFLLFGLGGVVLWGVLYPPAALFLRDGPAKRRRTRLLMHRLFRFYVDLMRRLGLLTYEVHGGDRLDRPGRLVAANHPSLIDVVFLIALIRNATCIVKPALAGNPAMRLPIRAADYLYADDPETLLEHCAAQLDEGGTLIVFPEGTRSAAVRENRFQRGAASIALRTGAGIVPVYIRCTPATLAKHHKWHHIPPTRVHYGFYVGEEIDPASYGGRDDRPLAARRLTRDLQHYFTEQERRHGKP